MTLINIIAAAHDGQCFALLGRRLQVPEDAAARGVGAIAGMLLPMIEEEIVSEAGMAIFLKRLESARFSTILVDPTAFSDSELRMAGRDFVAALLSSGRVSREGLSTAMAATPLAADQFAKLMPHATVLLLAALQRRLERPLRDIKARAAKLTVARDRSSLSPDDDAEPDADSRPQPRGVLGTLFGL